MNHRDHRFSLPAIGLHWLMALLILSLFVYGFYMSSLPLSPWRIKLYAWHKWAGITAFLIALLRPDREPPAAN